MAAEFDGWAIIELMGHRRLAGHVRDVTMFGGSFCRIDVPSEPPVTQYYGPTAIYCVTPTTEEIARRIGKACSPSPVSRYELGAGDDVQQPDESYDDEPDIEPDEDVEF